MSRRRRHVNLDPHWITARYAGQCHECRHPIAVGDRVFYYPNGSATYGAGCGCGERQSASFDSAVFDEGNNRSL